MNNKEIMKMSKEEVDDELFREMDCSWDKKTLINHIIDGMSYANKRDWIKQWLHSEKMGETR